MNWALSQESERVARFSVVSVRAVAWAFLVLARWWIQTNEMAVG